MALSSLPGPDWRNLQGTWTGLMNSISNFSVLVDKDQSPKWDPPTLEGVTNEHVDWYFSNLPEERELKL